ncbi:hypothetical protein CRYUN_Cryun18bG0089300 [Craigia yunnanensis]
MAVASDSIVARCFMIDRATKFRLKNEVFGAKVVPRRAIGNGGKVNGKVRVEVKATVQTAGLDEAKKPKEELGFDVVSEGELREKGFLGMRKTKLVCTIGPACCSMEDLEKLALGGMNVARLNMCHNTRDWHRDVIKKIKRLNAEEGFCISVMIDTEGSQIHEGSIWLFTAQKFEGSRPFTVQANYEGFSEGIEVGDALVIDGGMASFEVIEKVGNALRCQCTDSGLFLPRAKFSFWREGKLVARNKELPTLSKKDWADIEYGVSEGVDFIALSFVNDADSVRQLKNYLYMRSSRGRFYILYLSVIQKTDYLFICDISERKLEEIVKASDGIMVARGDLGVEIPYEQIPTVQEEITHVCRELNKPVIVASQLLESMVEYPTPTRAEVADVSEAVWQYADALMLSGESAIGPYGQKALSVLQMTSSRMELWSQEENRQYSPSAPTWNVIARSHC